MNPCRVLPRVLPAVVALAVLCLAAAPVARGAEPQEQTEEQKITALIGRVEALKDARFVRNGKEYDGKAAAEHMRRKRKSAGAKIKTAREFIERAASKSSASGQAYKIRFKDGKEQTSAEFLAAELERLERKKEPAR